VVLAGCAEPLCARATPVIRLAPIKVGTATNTSVRRFI
jgi:hypothetical protein